MKKGRTTIFLVIALIGLSLASHRSLFGSNMNLTTPSQTEQLQAELHNIDDPEAIASYIKYTAVKGDIHIKRIVYNKLFKKEWCDVDIGHTDPPLILKQGEVAKLSTLQDPSNKIDTAANVDDRDDGQIPSSNACGREIRTVDVWSYHSHWTFHFSKQENTPIKTANPNDPQE